MKSIICVLGALVLTTACQKEDGKRVDLLRDTPGVWKVLGEDGMLLAIHGDGKFEQIQWFKNSDQTFYDYQKGEYSYDFDNDALIYEPSYSSCYEDENNAILQKFSATTPVALDVVTPAGGIHKLVKAQDSSFKEIMKKAKAKSNYEEKCFTKSVNELESAKPIVEQIGFKKKQRQKEQEQKLEQEKKRQEAQEKKGEVEQVKRRNLPSELPKGTIDPDRPLQA